MRGELGEQVSPKAEAPSEHRSLVASLKEKQLEELRAQVARCGTRCGKLRHEHSWQSRNFEDELAWTVQQMEMHRRQIEAHQRQLSILERRHAEIVTALASGGSGGSVGKLFCMEDMLGSEVASTSSGKSHSTLLGFTNAMAAAEARLGQKDRRRDSRDARDPRDPRDREVQGKVLSRFGGIFCKSMPLRACNGRKDTSLKPLLFEVYARAISIWFPSFELAQLWNRPGSKFLEEARHLCETWRNQVRSSNEYIYIFIYLYLLISWWFCDMFTVWRQDLLSLM